MNLIATAAFQTIAAISLLATILVLACVCALAHRDPNLKSKISNRKSRNPFARQERGFWTAGTSHPRPYSLSASGGEGRGEVAPNHH